MGSAPADLPALLEAAASGRPGAAGGPTSGALLADWMRVVGGARSLRRLLRWTGARSPRTRVEHGEPVRGDPDVEWRAWLRDVVAALDARAGRPAPGEALAPLARLAWARVEAEVGREGLSLEQLLAPAAREALAADLDGRLLRVLGPSALEAARALPAAALLGAEALVPSVLSDLAAHALRPLFEPRPMLARLVATVLALWTAAQAELLVRAARDAHDLRTLLAPGRATPEGPLVASLGCGLGDPHRGGRRVTRVELSGGVTVAYKPRPLDGEALYDAVLAAAEAADPALAQRRPRFLARAEHGWVEWIEPFPAADAAAEGALLRRLGAHVANAHVLGLRDLHEENVLLAGEWPVLVDLECFLAAPPVGAGLEAAGPHALDLADTLVLARWQRERGAWASRGLLRPGWARPHREEIRAGYDATLAWWRELARRLGSEPFGPESPLRGVPSARARLVVRPTHAYVRLVDALLEPGSLDDPRRFDVRLDALVHGWLDDDARDAPAWTRLLEAERRALHRLDVPTFVVRGDSRAVSADGREPVPDVLATTPAVALAARLARVAASPTATGGPCLAAALADPLEPRADPEAAARAIASHLVDVALDTGDGAAWLGRDLEPARGLLHTAPVDEGLYQGNAGVAVFLLAAEAVLGDGRAGQLGRATLARIARRRPLAEGEGPGLAHGLAGQLLALRLAERVTGDGAWREAAVELGRRLGPAAAERALRRAGGRAPRVRDHGARLPFTGFDLHDGLAGLVLALAACEDVVTDALAARCARPLATRAVPRPERGAFLAGLAHGASGLAAALGVAASRERSPDAATAAWRAAGAWLAAERALFVPERGEWLDLRGPGAAVTTAWCHGAPGVLVARVTLLGAASDDALLDGVRGDLERARARTLAHADRALHGACCGEAGRVEVLALAGERESAARRATELARDAAARGGWCLGLDAEGAPSTPGLFQGLAGVGWALLRAAPRARPLPSPLAPWLAPA